MTAKADNSLGAHGKVRLPSDVVLAWLPFLVGFVSIPRAILLPNLIEFDSDIFVIAPFLVAGVASFVGLVVLSRFEFQWRQSLFLGLFFLGVFLLLSDILTPLQWGLLDGESELSEPRKASFFELCLVAVLAISWAKLPLRLIRAFGGALVLVVFLSEIVCLASGALAASEAAAQHTPPTVSAGNNEGTGPVAAQGNVYHVVFDGYSGLGFLEAARGLNLNGAMSGFTFFERTLANYQITDASVPSFLLGQFYDGEAIADWQQEARTGGLRRWLQRAGFTIEVYSPDRGRFWTYEDADLVHTSHDLAKEVFVGSDVLRLLHLTVVRLAPTFLRRESYRATDRLLGLAVARLGGVPAIGELSRFRFSGYHFYKRLSVPLLRKFLEEENARSGRGRYVYIHLVLPHSPFIWDKECNSSSDSSYEEQMVCATTLMGEIVESLKGLDRYEDSLVIFQSDHGFHRPEGGVPAFEFDVSAAIREKIRAIGLYPAATAEGYLRRIRPLLVVKPPHAGTRPLEVSPAPTQLIDVPATVVDLLGLESPATDGVSVFRLDPLLSREIHLYAGIWRKDLDGRVRRLGLDVSSSRIAHFSYTNGLGWKIYPDFVGHSD